MLIDSDVIQPFGLDMDDRPRGVIEVSALACGADPVIALVGRR
jgi:hypothetical protein